MDVRAPTIHDQISVPFSIPNSLSPKEQLSINVHHRDTNQANDGCCKKKAPNHIELFPVTTVMFLLTETNPSSQNTILQTFVKYMAYYKKNESKPSYRISNRWITANSNNINQLTTKVKYEL